MTSQRNPKQHSEKKPLYMKHHETLTDTLAETLNWHPKETLNWNPKWNPKETQMKPWRNPEETLNETLNEPTWTFRNREKKYW